MTHDERAWYKVLPQAYAKLEIIILLYPLTRAWSSLDEYVSGSLRNLSFNQSKGPPTGQPVLSRIIPTSVCRYIDHGTNVKTTSGYQSYGWNIILPQLSHLSKRVPALKLTSFISVDSPLSRLGATTSSSREIFCSLSVSFDRSHYHIIPV